MKYYAVYNGLKPGVYLSWEECSKNVTGFKGAIYKSFDTLDKANNYINNKNFDKNTNIQYNNDTNIINVYTDGSCYGNGSSISYAGYGIFFDKDSKLNRYDLLNEKYKTNNAAELVAILRVFDILIKEINDKYIINIYTDSNYSIKCFTDYGEKLYKSNWKNKNNIPNLELIKKGYLFLKQHSNNINLKHIYSHTNNQDIHSKSNFEADKLAKKGLKKSIKNSTNLGENKFKTGKYSGYTISDIHNLDKSYLIWYYKNMYKKEDMFTYILKNYLRSICK